MFQRRLIRPDFSGALPPGVRGAGVGHADVLEAGLGWEASSEAPDSMLSA